MVICPIYLHFNHFNAVNIHYKLCISFEVMNVLFTVSSVPRILMLCSLYMQVWSKIGQLSCMDSVLHLKLYLHVHACI